MASQLLGIVMTVMCMATLRECVPLVAELLQRDTTSRAMPVQMDMATDDDITICTGNERSINCRDGANMAITKVFWGRMSDKICPSDDADPVTDCAGSKESLNLVRKTCEGKKECKLAAKHKLLQNNGTSHCPGVNKYLVVNYTCIPESQGVTLCQNVETTLQCGAEWVMELADVFWGRRGNAKICGPDDSYECDSSDFASKVLKKKCNGKRSCYVKADPDELDSKTHTCGSIAKYLMINYICRPPPSHSSAEEDDEENDVKDQSSKELIKLVEKHIGASKTVVKQTPIASTSNTNAPLSMASPQPTNAIVQPKKQSLVVGKSSKKETTTPADDFDTETLSSVYKNIKKDETPKASNAKNEKTLVEESKQSTSNDNKEVAKDKVTKSTATPEESYELSEPNTVRSILDRAKEVLKTLDADALPATANDAISKRGGIAKHSDKKIIADAKFVNDTARAVKQVAQLAQTLVKHAEEKKIIKTKMANLMKKSIPQTKSGIVDAPKKQPVNSQQKQTVNSRADTKRNTLPKLATQQFGNTP